MAKKESKEMSTKTKTIMTQNFTRINGNFDFLTWHKIEFDEVILFRSCNPRLYFQNTCSIFAL